MKSPKQWNISNKLKYVIDEECFLIYHAETLKPIKTDGISTVQITICIYEPNDLQNIWI